MKYGFYFAILAILLACVALMWKGLCLLLLWPAASFAVVGFGYLFWGHSVFGKRADGTLRLSNMLFLAPFLAFLWSVWHLARLIIREDHYNEVNDLIIVGRRLLSSELPAGVETVVDLTCEFNEPEVLRTVSIYIAAPMLDGTALAAEDLVNLARRVSKADGAIYIHCAQGHGRTGTFTALLLLVTRQAGSVEEALAMIQKARPGVRINSAQRAVLDSASELL